MDQPASWSGQLPIALQGPRGLEAPLGGTAMVAGTPHYWTFPTPHSSGDHMETLSNHDFPFSAQPHWISFFRGWDSDDTEVSSITEIWFRIAGEFLNIYYSYSSIINTRQENKLHILNLVSIEVTTFILLIYTYFEGIQSSVSPWI